MLLSTAEVRVHRATEHLLRTALNSAYENCRVSNRIRLVARAATGLCSCNGTATTPLRLLFTAFLQSQGYQGSYAVSLQAVMAAISYQFLKTLHGKDGLLPSATAELRIRTTRQTLAALLASMGREKFADSTLPPWRNAQCSRDHHAS